MVLVLASPPPNIPAPLKFATVVFQIKLRTAPEQDPYKMGPKIHALLIRFSSPGLLPRWGRSVLFPKYKGRKSLSRGGFLACINILTRPSDIYDTHKNPFSLGLFLAQSP
jgi:hypothetical protein